MKMLNNLAKYTLLINALVECLGGIFLIFSPDSLLVLPSISMEEVVLTKAIGISAFFFGSVSYSAYKGFSTSVLVKYITLSFIAYHMVIGMHFYSIYAQGLTSTPGAFIVHVILALMLLYAYFKTSWHTQV